MPLEVVGSTALSSEADRSGAIMRGRTMDRVPRQFQLDVAAYRLLQDGRPVRLERQPMELLILLASRPGELVTRQEITARFWGEHVFVDIEGSINRIVAKVRLALHDNPEKPASSKPSSARGIG
jgi:DNA-binding response OmpR family regulator